MAGRSNKRKGARLHQRARNLRNLYNQGKKSRQPIKEQEVAQQGNVENLEDDEVSTR